MAAAHLFDWNLQAATALPFEKNLQAAGLLFDRNLKAAAGLPWEVAARPDLSYEVIVVPAGAMAFVSVLMKVPLPFLAVPLEVISLPQQHNRTYLHLRFFQSLHLALLSQKPHIQNPEALV